MNKNIINSAPLTYVANDLSGEETTGTFYQKELQKKKNQAEFRIEKSNQKKRR